MSSRRSLSKIASKSPKELRSLQITKVQGTPMLNAMLVRIAYADSDIIHLCINPKVTANHDHLVADHRAVILRAIDRPMDDHHLGHRHLGRPIVRGAHPDRPGHRPDRRPVRLQELLPEGLRERLQNANLGIPEQEYAN
jgi:hypothetical protein